MPDYIERARDILHDAIAEYSPVVVFAGFSGGHDSLVSTHFTIGQVPGSRALHANTGIGISATRHFVRLTSGDRGWNLVERRTDESYEDLVLGRVFDRKTGTKLIYPGGFPGAPMHHLMYQRLKERPIGLAATEARSRHPRRPRGKRWVMIVTGIRGDESTIRTGYKRAVNEDGPHSLVWVNPFYWSTYDDFKDYRRRFDLPTNPVCMTLGFSGECLCGAHADKGELLRIRLVEPETADRIEVLQRRANGAGFPWGYEDNGPPKWFREAKVGQRFFDFSDIPSAPDFRPMCHNCDKVKGVPPNLGPCPAFPAPIIPGD